MGIERLSMTVAELQELEEIKALVARGQQVGVLTHAEIATAVAELDLDEADMRGARTASSSSSEIELVEEIDPAHRAPARSSARPTSAAAARRSRRRWTCGRT